MTEFPWQVLGQVLVFSAVVMFALYLFQFMKKNANIVDVGWAFLMGTAAAYYASFSAGDEFRIFVVGLLGAFWGYRLGYFLFKYRVAGHGNKEDGRYAALRETMGKFDQPGFFAVFMLQATWVPLLSIPIFVAAFTQRSGFAWYDMIGVVIWFVAIFGELLADQQLESWRSNPANKGKTCRKGLWKYSRHPNYFFEWVHWFAYIFFAVGSAYWWVTLLGPVVMFLFLFYITGIPFTEKRAVQSRDDYREYQKTTSIFIPWFPKES